MGPVYLVELLLGKLPSVRRNIAIVRRGSGRCHGECAITVAEEHKSLRAPLHDQVGDAIIIEVTDHGYVIWRDSQTHGRSHLLEGAISLIQKHGDDVGVHTGLANDVGKPVSVQIDDLRNSGII